MRPSAVSSSRATAVKPACSGWKNSSSTRPFSSRDDGMRLLRLITGLVVAAFVVGHFSNHALGVISFEAMDRMRAIGAAWWRSPPGTLLLYGSLLTHFALALVSLYRRTTLRMPLWEAAQLILGLAIPP